MKALFFGSIGTLADTSEQQRHAFNAAFRQHGLDWAWDRDEYRAMLREAGGRHRIEAQARAAGAEVDATAIHATKSELFRAALSEDGATARPGLRDAITRARAHRLAVGLVTTTSRDNVDALLDALSIERDVFDVIVTAEEVSAPKPAPDAYHYAAATLGLSPGDCLAVEDNVAGAEAALAAGMACLAWPGENNEEHDFGAAQLAGEDIAHSIWPAQMAAQ